MKIIEMEELMEIEGGSSGGKAEVTMTGGWSNIEPHKETGLYVMAFQGGRGATSPGC